MSQAIRILLMCLFLTAPAHAAEVYLPHLTGEQPQWLEVLEVDNPGSASTTFRLELFKDGTKVYNATLQAPGRTSRNHAIPDLATQAQCGRITYDAADLVFRLTYLDLSRNELSGLLLPQAHSGLAFVFNDVLPVNWQGLAFMNAGAAEQEVTLFALGDGVVLDEAGVVLQPLTRTLGFVHDFFPELDMSEVDMVAAVTSGAVLAGMTLTDVGNTTNLQAFPALPLAGGFGVLPQSVILEPVALGFSQPVHVTHAGDNSGRIFVTEREGRIRIVQDGTVLAAPFLDISGRVGAIENEQGLLCTAFPPGFVDKGTFYVNYTDTNGTSTVSRFSVQQGQPGLADPNSEKVLLSIVQPFANHNGGQLAFGPDGFLYIGVGDGGGVGDPLENGQNGATLLGTILRIDVESGESLYGIPSSNPFVSDGAVQDEIWALGLRNPWRFSFDHDTGALFIGDVGQSSREEIDRTGPSEGGLNFGWNTIEGNACFDPPSGCGGLLPSNYRAPIHDYGHDLGNSVTGGFVYRGGDHPVLGGVYVYGDFVSGRIWGLLQEGGTWQNRLLLDSDLLISSFGEDGEKELYVCGYGSGTLYRIAVP